MCVFLPIVSLLTATLVGRMKLFAFAVTVARLADTPLSARLDAINTVVGLAAGSGTNDDHPEEGEGDQADGQVLTDLDFAAHLARLSQYGSEHPLRATHRSP